MTKKTTGALIQRGRIDPQIGNLVGNGDAVFQITEVLDFESLIGVDVNTGKSKLLKINELAPLPEEQAAYQHAPDIDEISDISWEKAEERYAAILPLLDKNRTRRDVELRAEELHVNVATLYRWLKQYTAIGSHAGLIPRKRGWSTGKSRIEPRLEKIIQGVIEDIYLNTQRASVQRVIEEVQIRCKKNNITAPNPNTIRARVNKISPRKRLHKRGFKDLARNKYHPAPGTFPHADYPLAVVQIDHTPVDIILVDDTYREPIGRPWITLAMDVYSRMVTGYYLSFDPPSETSVALCVSHSILPKDEWLTLHSIDAEWNLWGMMDKIHVDNGGEFRSDNFRQSCLMHGIDLEFRPVKQPQYGGHIERLLGTLLKEIHNIPGTTFSSIKDREGYDSDKNAVMTLSEFEGWLVTLICKKYHKRVHTGILMTPDRKWELGIFGDSHICGRGIPPRPVDRLSLQLDFLPSFQRTIQTFGVTIEGLAYYSEVLSGWIGAEDPNDRKRKRKFTFRRDPRDISRIWFYDPEIKQYFSIPFADQTLPSISMWEHKKARALTKERGIKSADESQILDAIIELRSRVDESKRKTRRARLANQRRIEHEKGISPATPQGIKKEVASPTIDLIDDLTDEDIQATDDIA